MLITALLEKAEVLMREMNKEVNNVNFFWHGLFFVFLLSQSLNVFLYNTCTAHKQSVSRIHLYKKTNNLCCNEEHYIHGYLMDTFRIS